MHLKITNNKLPTAAIAIILGLILAYIGGSYTLGEKGIADIKIFTGLGTMGGPMFRDFAIVSTALGASLLVIKKKSGWLGVISLILGVSLSFLFSVAIALLWGYRDAMKSYYCRRRACTYIVGACYRRRDRGQF